MRRFPQSAILAGWAARDRALAFFCCASPVYTDFIHNRQYVRGNVCGPAPTLTL